MKILNFHILLLSVFATDVLSWNIPPKDFVKKFISLHDRGALVMYLPSEKTSELVKWHKSTFFQSITSWTSTKEHHKDQAIQVCYKYLHSTTFNQTVLLHKKDLHIFIVDEDNVSQSLSHLTKIMKSRRNVDKEFWLVDVSGFQTISNAVLNLQNMPLDIDDDFFLYINTEKFIHMWEYYEIHSSKPRKLQKYGSWNRLDETMNLTNVEKWSRRNNLEVVL